MLIYLSLRFHVFGPHHSFFSNRHKEYWNLKMNMELKAGPYKVKFSSIDVTVVMVLCIFLRLSCIFVEHQMNTILGLNFIGQSSTPTFELLSQHFMSWPYHPPKNWISKASNHRSKLICLVLCVTCRKINITPAHSPHCISSPVAAGLEISFSTSSQNICVSPLASLPTHWFLIRRPVADTPTPWIAMSLSFAVPCPPLDSAHLIVGFSDPLLGCGSLSNTV